MKAAVIQFSGTNCEDETADALAEAGFIVEKLHYKQLLDKPEILKEEKRKLEEYDAVVLPGGFSYGDYVRAGAIAGAVLISELQEQLKEFSEEGRPIIGICNGFQILCEAGLLPGTEYQVALIPNQKNRFECRWIYLRHENSSAFTGLIREGEILRMPVAHWQGRFYCSDKALKELEENDMVVFRYVTPEGEASEEFPWNPNGSLSNIAGICNLERNILGLMPHPERASWRYQYPDWTRKPKEINEYGDGMKIWKSLGKYLKKMGGTD